MVLEPLLPAHFQICFSRLPEESVIDSLTHSSDFSLKTAKGICTLDRLTDRKTVNIVSVSKQVGLRGKVETVPKVEKILASSVVVVPSSM